jgi:hypothetical protein
LLLAMVTSGLTRGEFVPNLEHQASIPISFPSVTSFPISPTAPDDSLGVLSRTDVYSTDIKRLCRASGSMEKHTLGHSNRATCMASNIAVGDIGNWVSHIQARSMVEHTAARMLTHTAKRGKALHRAGRIVVHTE